MGVGVGVDVAVGVGVGVAVVVVVDVGFHTSDRLRSKSSGVDPVSAVLRFCARSVPT